MSPLDLWRSCPTCRVAWKSSDLACWLCGVVVTEPGERPAPANPSGPKPENVAVPLIL